MFFFLYGVCVFQPSTSSPSTLSNGSETSTWIHGGSPASDSLAPTTQCSPLYFQVCREYQRGTCTRPASDCRYAHPTENVTVESGDNTVTVCMDFLKGKCCRDACRYFHPPAHLQAQIKATQQRANSAAAAAAAAATATAAQSTHSPSLVSREAPATSAASTSILSYPILPILATS